MIASALQGERRDVRPDDQPLIWFPRCRRVAPELGIWRAQS